MKSLRLTIALILGTVLSAWGQSTPIDISMERLAETGKDWNMIVTVDLSGPVNDGLALDLPNGIRVVPVSVQRNGEALWLKQSETAPELASTLTWFEDDSGRVVLRFTENRLTGGDQLVITCTANMKNAPTAESEVALKRLIRQGNRVQAGDETLGRRALPTIEENN